MPGVDVARARRWFWGLVVTAVLATGVLYWAVGATPGPGSALVLLVSALVATAATLQAARVLRALNGPLDLSIRRRWERGRQDR